MAPGKIAILGAALWALLACSSTPRDLASLPSSMHGRWGWSEQSCRTASDDGLVLVDARSVVFAASRYDLTRIAAPRSDGFLRAEAIAHEEGYEQSEPAWIELKLASENDLSIRTETLQHSYVRCRL